MFELSGVNYEEVLEQVDSILVRVIGGSSYRDYTVCRFDASVSLIQLSIHLPKTWFITIIAII